MQKTEGGDWQCCYCGRQSKVKTNIFEHIEASHMETPGYLCEICNKHCRTRNALRAHKHRSHNQNNSVQFWFVQEINVKDCFKEFLPPGYDFAMTSEGTFMCNLCGYTCGNNKQRMQYHHEAKHTQSPGYQCPSCEKICPTKNALLVHKSRAHRFSEI